MSKRPPYSGEDSSRENAFGFLRLLLATLVIVSHTPEMLDGTQTRDPLMMVFGTVSLGDLALDGFFIISGYLIVGSFLKSGRVVPYLCRRVGRIYPAFLVATLVSLLVVAPLAGTNWTTQSQWAGLSFLRVLLLQQPYLPDVFVSNPLTLLNGPMWTIAYEFRCYLLVILLAFCGLFRHPALVAMLAALMLAASQFIPLRLFEQADLAIPYAVEIVGHLQPTLRLTGLFLAGAVILLCPQLVPRTKAMVALCVAGLLVCLCFMATAEIGIAVFGSLLIFSASFRPKGSVFNRINARTDISYGVYLYAWPVGQLLVYHVPEIDVWTLGIATIVVSFMAGWASWHLIERHAIQASRRLNWTIQRRLEIAV